MTRPAQTSPPILLTNMPAPKFKAEFNFRQLKEAVGRYLDQSVCDHLDCDCKHYIFEAAMETFFDKDAVWNYINNEMLK